MDIQKAKENIWEKRTLQMANKTPNTEALSKYAKIKTETTLKKIDGAIKHLLKEQEKINFNSVSLQAGVSKVFLYKNESVRNRIETLRQQQEGLKNIKQVKRNMTDNSKDIIITSLKKRISELEKENKELKTQLKVQFGKIYDS